MEGRILGNRYELIEKIGGGGMAIVYKAKCKLLNRFVAVKILRSEFTNDEEFVKRFRIEAQAAASLSHPNIVSIFDVGQENDIHYIVMEYIDGITLKDYISQKGSLPWKEAVKIGIQICSAIEQAHKNHIVHRDIKPHNIMLTQEGIAKVTDFGIARAVSSSTITMVGSTIGSVHYFSPEQARGGFTDEKSDLYSLGITIYEMVTGRVPFDGETPVAIALKHIQDNAEAPTTIIPTIPKGLNDIIMKAIRKEQNTRYPNASEMLADLQKILREPGMEFEDDFITTFPTRRLDAVDKSLYQPEDSTSGEAGNDRTKLKQKDKISVWLGILTGLIIAGVLIFFGYKLVVPLITPDPEHGFVTAEYVGKNFDDVKEELKKSGIEAVEKKRIPSNDKEKDTILSQSVDKDQPLNEGSTIYFEVSDGPEVIKIPDIKLKETRIAEQALIDAKLKPVIKQENNDKVATGLIVRVDPEVGQEVKPGTEVTLYESLGPQLKMVNVPDLSGQNRAGAEKLLLAKNLKVGKLLPEGVVSEVAKVISQYPKANASVEEGTAVEITFDIKTGSGSEQATPTPEQNTGSGGKISRQSIVLSNPAIYADEIAVYVEVTPSDTNQVKVLVDRKVKKDEFPLSIEVPIPENGTTHVLVKLDDKVVYEQDEQ